MRVYTLNKKQIVSKNILEVFDFFSKPENLSIITPKKLDFKILTPIPIKMKEGALIDYTIKVMAIPLRWKTLITTYEPPHLFIDQQLKGPYSMWHHTHTFKKINDTDTMIEDTVRYSLPYSFIGVLAHFLFVKKDLNNIFMYRNKKIDEIFN